MANHASAAKRARQALRRRARNASRTSAVHTAEKKVRSSIATLKGPELEKILGAAFSTIQKARKTLHRNTIKRKMARLAKAVSQKVRTA